MYESDYEVVISGKGILWNVCLTRACLEARIVPFFVVILNSTIIHTLIESDDQVVRVTKGFVIRMTLGFLWPWQTLTLCVPAW